MEINQPAGYPHGNLGLVVASTRPVETTACLVSWPWDTSLRQGAKLGPKQAGKLGREAMVSSISLW